MGHRDAADMGTPEAVALLAEKAQDVKSREAGLARLNEND